MEQEESAHTIKAEEEGDIRIYRRVSVSWLLFLFGCFLLAACGVFLFTWVAILGSLIALGTLWALRSLRPSPALSRVGIGVLLFAILSSYTVSPTVFSGRDQGAYSNAAIRLAESHALTSGTPASESFFERYGPGKALNFPGFFYTERGALETQFPLGYIVWLSAHFSLFGIAGLSLANAFTLVASLTTLFLLLRLFLSVPLAIGGTVVAALSFPLVWIFENTLSENLAMPLFLMTAFHAVLFVRDPRSASWFLMMGSAIFLSLTRIEGVIVAPIALFLPLSFPIPRQYLRDHLFSTLLPGAVGFVGLTMGSVMINTPFYTTIGKAFVAWFSTADPAPEKHMGIVATLERNLELFWTYGMISVALSALLGAFFLFRRRNREALILLFLAAPTFVYFISSHISADYPWALRRFVFSVWPTLIFLAFFAVSRFQQAFQKRYPDSLLFRPALFSIGFSSLFILSAIPSVLPILTSTENPKLLADTQLLSKQFSDRDLILVDRLASGDPFSMIADPLMTLFGKSAVYFFRPEDLLAIDRSRFNRIFLVVPAGEMNRHRETLGSRFTFSDSPPFPLRTAILSRETNPLSLPSRKNKTVDVVVSLLTPIQ